MVSTLLQDGLECMKTSQEASLQNKNDLLSDKQLLQASYRSGLGLITLDS